MPRISFRYALEKFDKEIKTRLMEDIWLIDLGNNKYIGTMVFEKYYFRVSNRAALVVIIDNIKGTTGVRAISTGSSQDMIFNFDWGAADNFTNSVRNILEEYIIK